MFLLDVCSEHPELHYCARCVIFSQGELRRDEAGEGLETRLILVCPCLIRGVQQVRQRREVVNEAEPQRSQTLKFDLSHLFKLSDVLSNEAEGLQELKDSQQVQIHAFLALQRAPVVLPDVLSDVSQGLRHERYFYFEGFKVFKFLKEQFHGQQPLRRIVL